jgi:predicted membrane protein
MGFIAGLTSILVVIQVFAMRWNVVIGGQMFSKSFRGFVEYQLSWGGREGLIATIIILVLPLVALLIANRVLPLWDEEQQPS